MSRTYRTDPWALIGNPSEEPWKQHSRPSGAGGLCHGKTEAPSWWTHEFDILPRRRRDKAFCKAILDGMLDPEDIGWGVVDPMPHVYYW